MRPTIAPTAAPTVIPSSPPADGSIVKRVALVLIQHTNDPIAWTQADARTSANETIAYYREVSYGAVAMTFDLYGPVTVPEGTTACTWGTWLSAAISAAGIDTTRYTNVMGLGTGDGCTFSGVGSLGGTRSYLNNTVRWQTMAHELGHNYGLRHASFLLCMDGDVRVTLSASCELLEYTDRYDRMGSGALRHFSSYHRHLLGYGVRTVTVTTDRTLTIGVASVEGAANQLVLIPRPDGTSFALEYRQHNGTYDWFSGTTETGHKGVLIRIVGGTIRNTRLLDMSPTADYFNDTALLPGKTFNDGGIRITVNSVSTTGASVTIDVP